MRRTPLAYIATSLRAQTVYTTALKAVPSPLRSRNNHNTARLAHRPAPFAAYRVSIPQRAIRRSSQQVRLPSYGTPSHPILGVHGVTRIRTGERNETSVK